MGWSDRANTYLGLNNERPVRPVSLIVIGAVIGLLLVVVNAVRIADGRWWSMFGVALGVFLVVLAWADWRRR